MALIHCPQCDKEISDKARACPKCGYSMKKPVVKLCPECGREVAQDASACPFCGYPFPKPQENKNEKVHTQLQSQSSKKKWLLLGGVGILIIIAVVAMILLLGGEQNQQDVPTIQQDSSSVADERSSQPQLTNSSSSESEDENQFASEVIVTVTDKINVPEDIHNGIFSNRVEFKFEVENQSDKDIKGIQGKFIVKDLFGEEIIRFGCDFTGKEIPAKSTVSFSDLGLDINQFKDNHTKLYQEEFEYLIFEYTIDSIVYSEESNENDGDSDSQESTSSTASKPTSTQRKICAATPCPNVATDGAYCAIHAKGKTKKCAFCGKAIWDDEVFCDECLFG